MGQRANLIIVENDACEVFYTHHRANTLDCDLFWGLKYAIGFIRAQQVVEGMDLLDEVWAEGGAILDLDHRLLLWFGGDVGYSVPLKRVHAKLMQQLWPGWKLYWATEGVCDFADYLKLPRSTVLSHEYEPEQHKFPEEKLVEPVDERMWTTLASFRFSSDSLAIARLRPFLRTLLYAGEGIISAAETRGWDSELVIGERNPMQGFHIDVPSQTLGFWHANSFDDAYRRVQGCWPGWQVEWWGDEFERHARLLGNAVTWPRQTDSELVQEWRGNLLSPNEAESGAESVVKIAKLMGDLGEVKSIEVNSQALHDARLLLPIELRTELFARAVRGAAL